VFKTGRRSLSQYQRAARNDASADPSPCAPICASGSRVISAVSGSELRRDVEGIPDAGDIRWLNLALEEA